MGTDKSRRVLIVDDCADTRLVFTHLFQQLGAEVTTAADGFGGIIATVDSITASRPFNLILMDIRMPEVNGMEAALVIRQNGFQGLIAAFTANALGEGRKESQESGINVYFDKRVVNKPLLSALLDQADFYPQS